MPTSPKGIGKKLNQEWGVNARHALYRENGTWYHHLQEFPGALFDANGYVLFKTKQDYLNCQYLQLGKQVSCPIGISAIPNYVQVKDGAQQASDLTEPEGATRALCITNRIVRDTPLARKVKSTHNDKCQICGIVVKFYCGQTYSEAHHIKPLGSVHKGPDVEGNIICVCPNCHAQLDYGGIEINKTALGVADGHKIADKYIDYHNNIIFKAKLPI